MQASTTDSPVRDFVVEHPLDPADAVVVNAIRSVTSSSKGLLQGIEARRPFNDFMESVSPRDDVTFKAGSVGGIPGLWVYPTHARSLDLILHLHGGWFSLGSANAYRHLVGHIAARASARAFIPDYRLAPEHPFPAATDDVLTCYQDLADRNVERLALTGDSAGGNLALGLASRIVGETLSANPALVGIAVMSPVTDLTLSGASYETRADADPLFTRSQIAGLVHSYLENADPKHPLASPLLGRLTGLPPVRVHVGDDEVLLDDSRRYVERAVTAGVDAELDVWIGMSHGFVGGVDKLKAAAKALDDIGVFLSQRLHA